MTEPTGSSETFPELWTRTRTPRCCGCSTSIRQICWKSFLTKAVRLMSATQLSPQSSTALDEQIEQIVGRLAQRYPTDRISLAELEMLVRERYREFDNAAIHSFVAVLTERLVRRHIENR